jgi:hypothetical protein
MTRDARELPGTSTVVRLVRHVDTLFPPGSTKPTPRAFSLSSEDLDEARIRGEPALLSVFDVSRTTVQQAMDLRGGRDPMTAFGLPVAGICAIQVPGRPRLRVLEDPLPVEQGPGGEGHAGVEGLQRASGEAKAPVKQVQMMLVDLCYRI